MVADPWEDLQAEDLLLQQVLLVRRGLFFPVGRCLILSGNQEHAGAVALDSVATQGCELFIC